MLVSTRHKFVFLSNRKCASSSLVHSLRPYCSMAMDTDHRLRHASYKDYQTYILPFLRAKLGDEVDDYQVYCLFREPLDWIHSWYRFRTREAISPAAQPGHWEYAGHLTWPEFLAETMKKPPERFARIGRQSNFVKGIDGTTDGLTMFRFDEFDAFVEHMAAKVGAALDIVKFNVSPTLDSQPTEDQFKACRKFLAREYDIYSGIPKRA